jgi:hypothetical protein
LLHLHAIFIASKLLLVNAVQAAQKLVWILNFVLDVGPNLLKHIVQILRFAPGLFQL